MPLQADRHDRLVSHSLLKTMAVGGVQMIMLGVIGEYLWRNLEESRKKPLFLIEDQSDNN